MNRALDKDLLMKKNFLFILISVFIGGCILSSCSTSTDDGDTVLSRDCIISAVAFGTLNRTVHLVTTSGKDSTFNVNVTGSYYPLYIDQINYLVYNPDSLPVGTHTESIVFNTFTYSSGISIKSLGTGRDTTFVYSDSTDFSAPRTLTVYAADGSNKRNYTFDIRVHNEDGDSVQWQHIAHSSSNAVASFVESRSVINNGSLYVFGTLPNGTSQVVCTSVSAPTFDTAENISTSEGNAVDARSVHHFKDAFYSVSNGKVVTSPSGKGEWEQLADSYDFDCIAATSDDSLYAIADGQIMASADGINWNVSGCDEVDKMPTSEISSAFQTSRVDATYRQIIMAGYKEGEASVWKLDIDTHNDFSYPWIYIPQTEELADYAFPVLKHNTLLAYGDVTLLVGLGTDGVLAPFYTSNDNGRTWKPNELKHPTMSNVTAVSAAVDADNYLWIICSGSGDVYKGRLNRLGWKTEKVKFN